MSLKPMRGRESAGLLAWIKENFASVDLALTDVARWTIGAGPGSFTGMRLAAALVAGMAHGREKVCYRCVPQAVAIAACACNPGEHPDGVTMLLLFDGRNREILGFEVVSKQKFWIPTGREMVWSAQALPEVLQEYSGIIACPAYDQEPVLKAAGREGGRILIPEKLSAYPLISAEYRQFDNNPADLVYIRPAVFPKEK